MAKFILVHEDFPEQFVVAHIEAPTDRDAYVLAEAEGMTLDFAPGTYYVSPDE